MALNNWISNTSGNFSVASNWSLGRIPINGDTAVFSPTSLGAGNGNCTLDMNIACGISLQPAYQGVLNQNGRNISIMDGGTFDINGNTTNSAVFNGAINYTGKLFNVNNAHFVSGNALTLSNSTSNPNNTKPSLVINTLATGDTVRLTNSVPIDSLQLNNASLTSDDNRELNATSITMTGGSSLSVYDLNCASVDKNNTCTLTVRDLWTIISDSDPSTSQYVRLYANDDINNLHYAGAPSLNLLFNDYNKPIGFYGNTLGWITMAGTSGNTTVNLTGNVSCYYYSVGTNVTLNIGSYTISTGATNTKIWGHMDMFTVVGTRKTTQALL